MRSFARVIRMLSAITLFFFCWTFLPIYAAVAYAAEKPRVKNADFGARNEKQKTMTSGERLEKALEAIRENVGRAEDKAAKGADTAAEVESVKARKTEIDAIDIDLKKEFTDTEKKLKAVNLPKEILDRHNKFVKNYEDNLAELKTNVDAIERVKTPSALMTELAKTKKHLNKVKPSKKRKPFDPNKLPNGIVKAKERQPKLKKEEWEKELKKESIKEPKKLKAAQRQQQKPIMVASNGPLTGLLSDTGSISVPNQPESYPQVSDLSTDGLLQIAATATWGKYPYDPALYPLPWETDMMPEDMIETPETHVTDAIQAKAAELQNNPIKMFNWLYNNIQLVPSYGSIQGADMCLQTRQCNETDIASLTITMFRAADWPTRYEFVTAELDINRFMENMGGFTDPMAAITFAATGGIPVRPVISGGKITAVQFERVYATALLPMGYYIGAVMKRGESQPMWMPIDVSLKHYVTTPGIDINSAVPFDAQSFINQIQSTATINEAEGYVTNVHSALIQQTMQDYQARVQNYISQNTPTTTVGDVIGKREIKQVNYPHLSPTGWTKPVTARVQSHTLPDSMKSSISFNIPDPTGVNNGLSYTTSLPEIAGKKTTLSFSPATATDQAVIESYLPKPHPDGSPIQPSELPSSLPAYLINLKPELRIDGQVVASGAAITMGAELSFTIALNEAGIGHSQINNIILAGEYYGIGLDTGRMANLSTLKTKLETTKAKLETQNYADMTKEEIVGDLLYTTAAAYFAELDVNDEITAKLMNVVRYRAPSIGMFSLKLDVRRIFNIPTSAGTMGMMMDVDRAMQAVHSKDGSIDKVKHYMLASGSMSSSLENGVPEQLYSTPDAPAQGLSAVKALKIANEQGIPLFKITQANVSVIMPQLQLDEGTKSDIVNAVNAGKEVTVSKSNITFGDWVGCGYIIIDPLTGAGAYMISGGANGAILQALLQFLKSLFFLAGLGASLMGASFLAAFILPALLALFVSWMGSQIFNDFSWPIEISGLLTGLGLDVFTGILINQFLGASLFLPLAATPLGVIVLACLVVFTVVAVTLLYVYLPERRYYYAMGGCDEKRIYN